MKPIGASILNGNIDKSNVNEVYCFMVNSNLFWMDEWVKSIEFNINDVVGGFINTLNVNGANV